MRNLSEVLLAEAGELPDAHFRTNVQAEILCTGDTFRVRGRGEHSPNREFRAALSL